MTDITISRDAPVLVIGAGVMGIGIAQVAAMAGHLVRVFDAREGAAISAVQQLKNALEALAAKGKFTGEQVVAASARLIPIAVLDEAADSAIAIEAIVERLDAKRDLLRRLEELLGERAVIASNTSSISVTALSNGLKRPERLVGMHFFNPVPLMKLVEVVSGLRTDPAVAEAVFELSARWGKVPVHAASTPGFIVNRIARPFYAEALSLLQERASTPAELDACLRAAGFRMGPCELMDLIGHDTNFAVTESVFQSNFGDKRFAPSIVQRQLVDGGLLGRKSGQGFFEDGLAPAMTSSGNQVGAHDDLDVGSVVVHGYGMHVQSWIECLKRRGARVEYDASSDWTGLAFAEGRLQLTDGRPATKVALDERTRNVAVFDVVISPQRPDGMHLAWSVARTTTLEWTTAAQRWLELAGFVPLRVSDSPGLVVARTLAMLINEAFDAVQQGVCSKEGADAAMKLGVNYPAGPFEWLQRWSELSVVRILDNLNAYYRGERYRVSPELQQRAWAVPLVHAY